MNVFEWCSFLDAQQPLRKRRIWADEEKGKGPGNRADGARGRCSATAGMAVPACVRKGKENHPALIKGNNTLIIYRI